MKTVRLFLPVVLCFLALLCWAGQVYAMDLYTYDLDSLAYMSTDVVEATLGGQSTVQGYAVTQATVDAVYKGHFHPGQTVALDAQTVEFFYKTKGSDFLSGQEPLALGDHVFLFLTKAKAAFLYNVPEGADIYWPVPSGIKLVQDGKVLSFQQFSNPGPYISVTPQMEPKASYPTPAQFAEQVGRSVQYAASVASLLSPPGTTEKTPYLLALLHRRAHKEDGWNRSGDKITDDACIRLAETHDFPALSEALPLVGWPGLHPLAQGFNSPAGEEYVLARVADPALPVKQRLLFASVLRSTYFGDDTPAQWVRVAELAEANQSQEELCLALLGNLEDFINMTAQYAQQKAATPAQQKASAQVLSLLKAWYGKAPSEAVQFEIEKIAASGGRAAYNALHSPCGPIPSLAHPGQTIPVFTENGLRKLSLSYDALTLFENDADVSIAALLTQQETKAVTVLPTPLTMKGWQIGSGGGNTDNVALPDSLPPGPYFVRVQFRRGAKVVGTSHGFTLFLH